MVKKILKPKVAKKSGKRFKGVDQPVPLTVIKDPSWEWIEINGRKFKKHFRPHGVTELEGPIVE